MLKTKKTETLFLATIGAALGGVIGYAAVGAKHPKMKYAGPVVGAAAATAALLFAENRAK